MPLLPARPGRGGGVGISPNMRLSPYIRYSRFQSVRMYNLHYDNRNITDSLSQLSTLSGPVLASFAVSLGLVKDVVGSSSKPIIERRLCLPGHVVGVPAEASNGCSLFDIGTVYCPLAWLVETDSKC